jgi:hypothetical protein
MTLGCRAQPKMHLMTNSIQLNLILKRQVNLQKDNLQVTINHDFKVELIFKLMMLRILDYDLDVTNVDVTANLISSLLLN